MTRDEMITRITQIGSGEDVAKIRADLAELQTDLSADYNHFAEVESANAVLTGDIEDLRSANLKLFKQVGMNDGDTTTTTEPPKEKRKFEDLFDEKGGLK